MTHGGSTHLIVGAETLAGLDDLPGELAGFGPVIADIARQVALDSVDGEWTFQANDPDGNVVATGTTARRPRKAQRRRSRAEYMSCVFPGCRRASISCDLDHRDEFSNGGSTTNDNLAPLCRHHHMMRHNSEWRLKRLPDGDHQWISPLGHTYIRKKGPPD